MIETSPANETATASSPSIAGNASDAKLRLESQKLELEISQLAAPWWRRPSFILAALRTFLATLSLLYGLGSGYFQALATKLENQRHDLEQDVAKFTNERDGLEKEVTTLRNQAQQAQKAASEAVAKSARAVAEYDAAYASARALSLRRFIDQVHRSCLRPFSSIEILYQSSKNAHVQLDAFLDDLKATFATCVSRQHVELRRASVLKIDDLERIERRQVSVASALPSIWRKCLLEVDSMRARLKNNPESFLPPGKDVPETMDPLTPPYDPSSLASIKLWSKWSAAAKESQVVGKAEQEQIWLINTLASP